MDRLGYTIVIATFERPEELGRLLGSLAAQTRRPERTVIVDASKDDATRRAAESMAGLLEIKYEAAEIASAAQQRNQGARLAETPLVAFVDDDVVLEPDACEKLCAAFEADREGVIGGVAGRIIGMDRPVPRGALWWYYRIQAGYADPTYGGKLFGPAINCLPSYTEPAERELIRAQWLNSTFVFYRTHAFAAEQFPAFAGYSSMEDVHLSARIARRFELYFHTSARLEHRDAPNSWKRDYRQMARNRIANQRRVAREVLGFTGPVFELKLLLHRLFVSIHILRRRGAGWRDELAGTWS